MKIKEQTRRLAHVAQTPFLRLQIELTKTDKTDEVSSKHCFEVADKADAV
ncbi:hypothetical protein [Streptococcus pneumoniae]|nr:hypothetical protein [Streptococcus pneumoniae]